MQTIINHIKTKKATPTYSRIAIEPLNDNVLFPEDFKGSREQKEQIFIFEKIMAIILNGRNATFSIGDVFGVASTLPISLSSVRSMFDDWITKAIANKKIKEIPSLFPEDGKIFEKLC